MAEGLSLGVKPGLLAFLEELHVRRSGAVGGESVRLTSRGGLYKSGPGHVARLRVCACMVDWGIGAGPWWKVGKILFL